MLFLEIQCQIIDKQPEPANGTSSNFALLLNFLFYLVMSVSTHHVSWFNMGQAVKHPTAAPHFSQWDGERIRIKVELVG